MPDTERLPEIFERDFREIPLPPPDLWYPTSQVIAAHRWTRRLLLAVVVGLALIGALILGSQIRQLRGSVPDVAAPTTAASVLTKLTISGTVRDAATGEPIQNVAVYLLKDEPAKDTPDLHPVGFNYDIKWQPSGRAVTDHSGYYSIQAFPGRYRLTFNPWRVVPFDSFHAFPRVTTNRPYAPKWWPDAPTDASATVLDLQKDRADINASLRVGHEVSGTLTSAVTGLEVPSAVYFFAGGDAACCAIVVESGVSQDGAFKATLPDGTYRILFSPTSVSIGGLGTGSDQSWWGGSPDFDHAADVVVRGGDVSGLEYVYGTGQYTHAPPIPANSPPDLLAADCRGRVLFSSYMTSDYGGPARVTEIYGDGAFRVQLIPMTNSRSDPNVEVTPQTILLNGISSVADLQLQVGSLINVAVCAKDYDPAKTVDGAQGFHQLYYIGPRY